MWCYTCFCIEVERLMFGIQVFFLFQLYVFYLLKYVVARSMSLLHPVHFSFFWGGQIISYPSGGVDYSPPVAKRIRTVTKKLTYDELVDLVCKVASIDKNVFKVNLVWRHQRFVGSCVVYSAVQILDDDDMETMYDFARNMSNCADIYVETEITSSVYQPSSSQGTFVSLLNTVGARNVVFNEVTVPPLNVNLDQFPDSIVASDERVIITDPIHRTTEEWGF